MSTPLRYPGGKTRVAKKIIELFPKFKEYREIFVGGGSVFLEFFNRPNKEFKVIINDIYFDLICFWKASKNKNEELVNGINEIRTKYSDLEGKSLFNLLKENKNQFPNTIDKAIRFFILNRISFSGLTEAGGFSNNAYLNRFTVSAINRIKKLKKLLENVDIHNDDYEKIVKKEGDSVFIFADPPYFKAKHKKLYGPNGDFHLNFDFNRFASVMKQSKHKWLITLDDCPEIRSLFDFAEIIPFQVQYGMNNYKQKNAKLGNEIFICNYERRELK